MTRTRAFLAFLAALLCVGGISWLVSRGTSRFNWEFPRHWYDQPTEQIRADHDRLLGKPMPPLDLTQWTNGQYSEADLKGKVLVIDFWSTTCVPCLQAVPANNAFWAKNHPRGVVLIGVCTGPGQHLFQRAIEQFKIEYPVALDSQLLTQENWRIYYYPTYAVIDRKGILRAIGLRDEYRPEVVDKLLSERD